MFWAWEAICYNSSTCSSRINLWQGHLNEQQIVAGNFK
jgi:hypothetical protein